jgi:hypothetical protein
VFSKWLLKEFEPNASMPLYRQFDDGTHKQTRAEIKLDSFRVNEICEACNNGWMSQLEDAAKPLLLGLSRRSRELSDLTEEERGIVAAWAGKTAVIESRAVGAECPVSGEYLSQIRLNGGKRPAQFAVAACISGKKSFAHMQVGIIRDLIGGGKAAGNIVVLAIPNLAFVCAFPMLPIPYQCRCVKSLFTPLWPAPSDWRNMDQTPMPAGLQGLEHLSALAERIELFQSVK